MSLTPGSLEYMRLHHRIRRDRGRADEQSCVDCGERARDWSQRHGSDQMDVASYDPRCKRCHNKYDGNPVTDQDGEKNPGAKLTESQVVEIRAMYAAGGITQRQLAPLYGVNQQTISKVVRGDRWRHVVTQSA